MLRRRRRIKKKKRRLSKEPRVKRKKMSMRKLSDEVLLFQTNQDKLGFEIILIKKLFRLLKKFRIFFKRLRKLQLKKLLKTLFKLIKRILRDIDNLIGYGVLYYLGRPDLFTRAVQVPYMPRKKFSRAHSFLFKDFDKTSFNFLGFKFNRSLPFRLNRFRLYVKYRFFRPLKKLRKLFKLPEHLWIQ